MNIIGSGPTGQSKWASILNKESNMTKEEAIELVASRFNEDNNGWYDLLEMNWTGPEAGSEELMLEEAEVAYRKAVA